MFLFERQIFNNSFFKFTQRLMELCISSSSPLLQEGEVLYSFMEKVLFELLAKTSENKQIKDMAGVFTKLIGNSPGLTEKLLQERILNQEAKFFDMLLTSMDKDVRDVAQILVTSVTNKLFEEDKMEQVEQIMTKVFQMIQEECAKNWLKIYQFFKFIFDVTTAGQKQLDYMVEQKDLLSVILDFFLEGKSPVCTQKRQPMGSNYANPPFEPLMLTVSYIARNTSRITLQEAPQDGHLEASPQFLGTYGKSYQITEVATKMLLMPDLYDKALNFAIETEEVARLVAHVAFENEEFSYELSRVILRGINKAGSEDVSPKLDYMKEFMTIQDSLFDHRFDWIYGVPEIQVRYNSNSIQSPPRLGIAYIDQISEQVYTYKTNAFYSLKQNFKDSLLQIMFAYRNRYQKYMLYTIQAFLETLVADKSRRLIWYFHSLPAPTYEYARYPDWMRPWLQDQIERNTRLSQIGQTKKEIEIGISCISFLE